MTIWSPALRNDGVPIYVSIADQLERDVASGMLLPGSRLPTHRELANRLGVTVVTVSRAYASAAERGLVEAGVGRGTFVRSRRPTNRTDEAIDLGTNVVSAGDLELSRELCNRLSAVLATPYGLGAGSERHRSAGATWIGASRLTAQAERVVVTAGAQQAVLLAFASMARPGDTVMAEALSYHGMKAIASLLHLRLAPLPVDRFGLIPESFEQACKKKVGRLLYVTPTLQNPTGSIMPDKRRKEIAAIATRYDITIVEDDVYGFLAPDAPLPIAAAAPERTIFITGTGKSLSPALRVGYLLSPASHLGKVETALTASTLFTSPIAAEIAATWIEDGTAARVIAVKRAAIAPRQRIARRLIEGLRGDVQSPHLWMELPKPWTAAAFAEEAARRGVRVAAAGSFATGREIPNAVRLSLGAPLTAADLETGLRIIAALRDRRSQRATTPVV